MLIHSQPLSSKTCEKLGLDDEIEEHDLPEKKIIAQRIGDMGDDFLGDDSGKITLGDRFHWFKSDIKKAFWDLKYSIRSHLKWRKTIGKLLPFEGFNGLIEVMQTHLQHYIEYEGKFGHSEDEYRRYKIDTAKETLELLERMKDPDGYTHRRREAVEVRYPDYKYLISEYEDGGCLFSGDFVAQGNGWAGIESGKDPRKGYFEFVDGRFTLANSPDQKETDRILAEHEKYEEEIHNAYKEAIVDSDKDFERLGQLLKENLYSWWD